MDEFEQSMGTKNTIRYKIATAYSRLKFLLIGSNVFSSKKFILDDSGEVDIVAFNLKSYRKMGVRTLEPNTDGRSLVRFDFRSV